MAVPDFQTLMLPVLQAYRDGSARSPAQVRGAVATMLNISDVDQAEMLPVARQTRFANRTAWAHSYLKQALLIESPRRGQYRITDRGREVLASGVERIDIGFLSRYAEFQEFRARTTSGSDSARAELPDATELGSAQVQAVGAVTLTPDEQIRVGYQQLQAALADQLLERVKQASPAFFETLVVKLLVAMGYGGSEEDAAQVVGRSGDGGIDGIIKEDRLGFDSIYVQAKRWENTVGRPTIQQFAGALQGHRARKGTVITTSSFSRDAIDYAATLQSTLVLIDGAQLAQLMIDYGVGVTEIETLRLKRLDEDYFEEE